ncbi:alpha/beta hydrolase [Nocardia vaccinii]|uniref:alpha/beta hydrolase n=1 Tax=Nocardia vaccinii TaxID=1822 RepID=UPI000832FF3D|nr:alpha/beta hydrolase family protein [Nocardia vaccinii]
MPRLPRILVGLLVVCAVSGTAPSAVSAAPAGASAIVRERPLGGRQYEVDVYSAAMGRTIPVWVSHPDRPAPALYLLNAGDGGDAGDPWTTETDVGAFFADKPVNVVVPMGGRASYYTDWQAPDPLLGRNEWATFLTRELPPLLAQRFQLTGRNAVAGTSMSATSALDLAIQAPGMYRAVGAFSGCTRTADTEARAYIRAELLSFGVNANNMWGGDGDPAWVAHDPVINAERLRGVALYLATGDGQAGVHDTLADRSIAANPAALVDRLAVGGAMETVVRNCMNTLAARLHTLAIPATVNYYRGTHSWPYWQDDLHGFWPVAAAALGV